jgi:hypothetical protein
LQVEETGLRQGRCFSWRKFLLAKRIPTDRTMNKLLIGFNDLRYEKRRLAPRAALSVTERETIKPDFSTNLDLSHHIETGALRRHAGA